ncbi:MAG: hypothetical protein AAGC64_03015 [Bacteroidota bacterium]
MRLPVIKHLVEFIEQHNEDFVTETIETLESLADAPTLKDAELDTIGELLSNLYGAIEVRKDIQSGTTKKEALNRFMKRVVSSIDN